MFFGAGVLVAFARCRAACLTLPLATDVPPLLTLYVLSVSAILLSRPAVWCCYRRRCAVASSTLPPPTSASSHHSLHHHPPTHAAQHPHRPHPPITKPTLHLTFPPPHDRTPQPTTPRPQPAHPIHPLTA
ncbi:uncharacterized protein K452DRAFT_63931 [Aplosporella prunicola CBS 121167]|uniref:Uncharacterized protein n=1 Tax=Aplosporella prunicola CBS 121167 TaxID=1176127 RepID=A0A6A6B8I7_9PEZI|nr:uncharacterized protein K452DRAFT_63931 [Aplosporella prunicola CBS 121167]KAF2139673.1 hypothetical protein K452DRAFT_63931 [Aplosporella prunicola CBS 121167]